MQGTGGGINATTMKKIFIRKVSGEKQLFQPEKIVKTCLRAGATKALANRISREVSRQVREGTSTRKILQITLRLLEQEKPYLAARYDLKGAILRLGPAGYAFEFLMAEILRECGYQVQMPPVLKGACVSHEVDIVAEKNGTRVMIECKYRKEGGVYIGVKEALYTWARFLDLEEGHEKNGTQKFDECWLVCNTRFSTDAIKYSRCKKMRLVGWHYPPNRGLANMIERKKIYPITVLRRLDKDSQNKMSRAGLMLCRDLVRNDFEKLKKATRVRPAKLSELISEASQVLAA